MADELIRLDKTIVGIDALITKAETAAEANELFKAKDVIYSQQRYFADVQPVSVIKELQEQIASVKWSVKSENSDYLTGYIAALSAVEGMIDDIQPVKHGYWEEVVDYGGWGDTHYRCSVCGEEWYLEDGKPKDNNMNFCPRCGARMDGVEHED